MLDKQYKEQVVNNHLEQLAKEAYELELSIRVLKRVDDTERVKSLEDALIKNEKMQDAFNEELKAI